MTIVSTNYSWSVNTEVSRDVSISGQTGNIVLDKSGTLIQNNTIIPPKEIPNNPIVIPSIQTTNKTSPSPSPAIIIEVTKPVTIVSNNFDWEISSSI